MDFTATETDEGIKITGPRGEVVATFLGSASLNPAYLVFIQGLLHFPKSELWNESRARYDVQYGEIGDDEVKRELAEVLVESSNRRW